MCSPLRLHLLAAGLVVAVSCPATAPAQPAARSLAELARVVSVGQTVTVTDAVGAEVKGRITRLSPASLTLAAEQASHTFAETDILLILQRRSDSVLNVTLIGAASAVGAIGIMAAVACSNLDCDWSNGDDLASLIAVYGGIGAGIGALVDLGIRGNRTVYLPAANAKSSVGVAPLVERDR